MRIWNSEHTFNHSWDTVVTAAWRKYPNPHNPSVTGLDVVDRSVDSDGKLKSHRLLSTSWGIPTWVAKMIGMQELCYASEHSTVDPKGKTFTLRTRNVTLSNIVTVDEQLIYCQHPTDPNKTLLKQEATVTVSGIPLCSKLEQMMTDAMSNNASKVSFPQLRYPSPYQANPSNFSYICDLDPQVNNHRLAVQLYKGWDRSCIMGRQAMEYVIDKVKKEARELTAEAQKCMDNVLPKTNSL